MIKLVFLALPMCSGADGPPDSHLKAAQMITEPEGLDDHGGSLSQRAVTERTDFLATH